MIQTQFDITQNGFAHAKKNGNEDFQCSLPNNILF